MITFLVSDRMWLLCTPVCCWNSWPSRAKCCWSGIQV